MTSSARARRRRPNAASTPSATPRCASTHATQSSASAHESVSVGDSAKRDAADVDPYLEQEVAFWKHVAICGDWVEHYPTVAQMADAADAVVVGRFVGATAGNTVQGDAAEDFYAEVNLQVEVVEVLRPQVGETFELSMVLPTVRTPDEREPTLEELRANLPRGPAVLFIRARTDFDDLYILVNDKALWTRTARAALDNPIAHDTCLGHYGDEARVPFLGTLTSVDALIEELRQ